MMLARLSCLSALLILTSAVRAQAPAQQHVQALQHRPVSPLQDLVQYVDPFIGTGGDGNTLPGASLPFGMVKLSPDCDLTHSNSGYARDKNIVGFSHTHVSGTGGGPKYGNILLMPTTGPLDIRDHSSPKTDESASPGYYAATLGRYGIRAELTVTARAGIHRYRFPRSDSAHILFDMGSFLGQHYGYGEGQELAGSEIHILSPHEVEGFSRVRGGWNKGDAYTVYFYALMDTAAEESGTWKNGRIHLHHTTETDSSDGTGAFFTFHTRAGQSICVKVGISYISTFRARQNVMAQAPGWDFDGLRRSAAEVWNKELNKIIIRTENNGAEQSGKEGTGTESAHVKNNSTKKIFYTALYHTLLMPVDKTGENPEWRSSSPNYDDFYAIWDTYRSVNPLLTLICRSREEDIVRSLIDICEHEGYMPDARSGNCNGRTQGGSNADVLIEDAFAKGLEHIDYTSALAAMLKDAEIQPPGDGRKEGREGLDEFKSLGYVSARYGGSASRTLEYAYDDHCISMLAKGLGRTGLYGKYQARAANWKNLWRPVTDHGATGFIMPRAADGSWMEPFSVLTAGSWDDPFYESCSWEYSFYVPQDMPGLIELCGGKQAFVARLDTFFKNGYYEVGNEPGFLTPIVYNWAGRPDRTAEQVSRIRKRYFRDQPDGLPGNDDAGAMSSLFVFHAMGFFPVAGSDIYMITTPLVPGTTLELGNGKKLILIAKDLTAENIYIQSIRLDGKPYTKNWLRHADIANGATIEFIMGAHPSAWGTTDLPQ